MDVTIPVTAATLSTAVIYVVKRIFDALVFWLKTWREQCEEQTRVCDVRASQQSTTNEVVKTKLDYIATQNDDLKVQISDIGKRLTYGNKTH